MESVSTGIRRVPKLQASVVMQLRSWIDTGRLPTGNPLPPERVLAKELGVARRTLRAALDQLEIDGLITPAIGRGPRMIEGPDANAQLISNAVILITNPGDAVGPRQGGNTEHRGWESYVQYQVTQSLQDSFLPVLTVDPASMGDVRARVMAQSRPQGAIAAYYAGEDDLVLSILKKWHLAGIPLVVHGDSAELQEYDRVSVDHEAGAAALTQWAVGQGCKRIIQFWRFSATHHWLLQREAGYQRAMRKAGLAVSDPVRTPDLPFTDSVSDRQDESIFRQLAAMLAGYLAPLVLGANPVDAILVAADHHAYQVNAALRLLGKQPGKDVRVLGFDNSYPDDYERQWEHCGPAATMDKNNQRVGQELVDLLLKRINGRLSPEPQCSRIEPRLVVAGNL